MWRNGKQLWINILNQLTKTTPTIQVLSTIFTVKNIQHKQHHKLQITTTHRQCLCCIVRVRVRAFWGKAYDCPNQSATPNSVQSETNSVNKKIIIINKKKNLNVKSYRIPYTLFSRKCYFKFICQIFIA